MRTVAVVGLILEINAVIDRSTPSLGGLGDIKDAIREGSVLRLLHAAGANVSLQLAEPGFATWYADKLGAALDAYGPGERRDWCMPNSGLWLLLAWTSELLNTCDALSPGTSGTEIGGRRRLTHL